VYETPGLNTFEGSMIFEFPAAGAGGIKTFGQAQFDRALGTRPAWTKFPQLSPRARPITISPPTIESLFAFAQGTLLALSIPSFSDAARNVGAQSLANFPIWPDRH
jgi:hypothetical protein